VTTLIDACLVERRLKALNGLALHERICTQQTAKSERFEVNPIHRMQ